MSNVKEITWWRSFKSSKAKQHTYKYIYFCVWNNKQNDGTFSLSILFYDKIEIHWISRRVKRRNRRDLNFNNFSDKTNWISAFYFFVYFIGSLFTLKRSMSSVSFPKKNIYKNIRFCFFFHFFLSGRVYLNIFGYVRNQSAPKLTPTKINRIDVEHAFILKV